MPIPLAAVMAAMTAASMAASAMQARASNKANTGIAQANLAAQRRAQRESAEEARRQQTESKLGSVDAAGNRVQFVPGVGWVTTLAPQQQALQDASQREMLRQLREGGARAEQVDRRAVGRRNREDTLATEAERELGAVRRPDENALMQLLLARGAEQRNASADRAGNAVARQNIRAGGGSAAELMQGARAASDAASARQAGVDAQLQAGQEADRQFGQQRDRASQMYDYFRRASTSGTQAPSGYMPTGPQRPSTGVADQGLINVLARTPQQEYGQPGFVLGDTLSGAGNMLGAYYGMQQGAATDAEILGRQGANTGALGGGGTGFNVGGILDKWNNKRW